ncbi:hypothetical protein SKAU_G00321520 [Synaphobranchus kaupii]|uniref:Uncharacterized protein n=1 Tax=Synaphobranchus kaupii TaxID=118154 RepID=A0A9Q1IJY3_SYNKA|nr:hypothetical protein SKAU_G00321520 [Synaphobranchus kaupii]
MGGRAEQSQSITREEPFILSAIPFLFLFLLLAQSPLISVSAVRAHPTDRVTAETAQRDGNSEMAANVWILITSNVLDREHAPSSRPLPNLGPVRTMEIRKPGQEVSMEEQEAPVGTSVRSISTLANLLVPSRVEVA